MAEDLTDDPIAARILLRALREYSESCEPPHLHHNCPFAVEISSDLRGCGEECMDLLGKYGGPPASSELTLTSGITVRRSQRPRPRHSAIRQSQAYDARAEYLSESERSPRVQWSLQSLLYRFRELILSSPWHPDVDPANREAELEELLVLLGARGLSLSEHLQSSARFLVRMGLFAELVGNRVVETEEQSELGRWQSYIRREGEKLPPLPENPISNANQSVAFHEIVLLGAWSDSAAIDEVLAWSPPEASLDELLTRKPRSDSGQELDSQGSKGRWLVDRFTETYLDRWETESLCLEWSFVHGQVSPPCSPFELKAREVKLTELSAEMADRLVKHSRRLAKGPRGPRSIETNTATMTAHLVKPAASFLREGRFTEARALFEAILQTDSESADANNNLGFCLIPENPQLSLKYFDETEKLTGARSDLLAANRMLALAKLGQTTAVVDIAEASFGLSKASSDQGAGQPRPGVSSFVWNVNSILNGSSPQLDEVTDLRTYAAEILSAVLGHEIRD